MTTINRQITTRAELEALATEPEGETVDYKGEVDGAEWWELAKDVAAFANHLGGVIVVGARERPDGRPFLQGLDATEARALAEAYENVAKDRCRPSPLVVCVRIPWDKGLEILAVNVAANATGIVGAQFYTLGKNPLAMLAGAKRPTQLGAGNAWQFPVRTGKHNPPLPLDQAIMHMSTHARRISILLAGIADWKKVKIIWQHPADEKRDHRVPAESELRDLSIERNVARFQLTDGSRTTATIALDDIDTAWSEEDGSWAVRVSGYFDEVSNDKGTFDGVYIARPRSRAGQ